MPPPLTIESANIQFEASYTFFLQDFFKILMVMWCSVIITSVEVEQLLEAGAFLLELLSQRPPRFATSLPQQWGR